MIEKLPIDKIDIRYLLSMAIILISSIKKKRTTFQSTVLAILILWIAFGLKNTAFVLVSIAINIILLWIFRLNEYCFTVLNILNLYVYKMLGKSFEPRIRSTFDVSGILMLLTVKMGYISKFFDGNIANILDYIFFIPGLVTGPTAPYREFANRDRKVDVAFPYKQALITLVFLTSHAFLRVFPFKDYILSPDMPVIFKFIFLYLFNLCGRTKFHFAWNFAHCCFILYNLPEYLNIDFCKVEFTESVREISSYWNQFISLWLKTLFFNPLKEKSISKAVIVSHLSSAALHGINPCYLIFFLSFAMYSKPVSFANNILKFKILKQVQMIFFISYFSMPFYLLDVKELFAIWKNVYFYGHVYFTFWFIYYWATKIFRKSKKIKDESKKD
ncbi:uncharacterized protein VICG_00473 [Vittaforma corneae ATCC 50505]|uniref:MBOAT family protein n=1 Tax=Vittaforma corneae (strain ATCC 50505) TaxID=993615 RepID=L2GPD3_VITCO|nr:uncharacterized protein VICG_00473 [Vittaforma corneae ATCC 50505]ELA42375.1 hypothetical protein VICG_00473 [Vittaforma corneae ATCC 50505]